VESGDLPARRLESYRKLTAELAALARRQDERAWREKDQVNKSIAKAVKTFYKTEPKRKGR
jgi:ribosome biogenesis GTPase